MIFVYRAAIVAVATFLSALAGFGAHWVSASRLGFAVIYQKVAPPTPGRLASCCSAAMGRLSPSLSPPPAGCIGLLLPHFRDAGLHLLRSVEKSARANLSKAFRMRL